MENSRLKLRKDWNSRAEHSGKSISGVLLKGLHPEHNEYLNSWHVTLLKKHLLVTIPDSGSVLDVACGYGRLSNAVRSIRPDIQLIGMDFSYAFCNLFSEVSGEPSVCASMYDIPMRKHTLDGIIAVTALMYIEDASIEEVFRNVMGLLKPGAYALFLDPGDEYLKFISIFHQSSSSTSGKGFSKKEYFRLGNISSAKIVAMGGCPIFSFCLPLLHALRVTGKSFIARLLIGTIRKLDELLERFSRFTIHRWILIQQVNRDCQSEGTVSQ